MGQDHQGPQQVLGGLVDVVRGDGLGLALLPLQKLACGLAIRIAELEGVDLLHIVRVGLVLVDHQHEASAPSHSEYSIYSLCVPHEPNLGTTIFNIKSEIILIHEMH